MELEVASVCVWLYRCDCRGVRKASDGNSQKVAMLAISKMVRDSLGVLVKSTTWTQLLGVAFASCVTLSDLFQLSVP